MNDAFVGNGRLHRPLAPLVLPAVYDDVLSYEEWLSKVVARCNELTDLITTTMENIEKEVSGMVDARIDVHLNERLAPIQRDITQLNRDLTDAVDNLNTQIDELDDKVDENKAEVYARITREIAEVNTRITLVQTELNRRIDGLLVEANAYTDQKFLMTQAEVNRKIAEYQTRWNVNFSELNDRVNNIIKEYPRLYDPATGFKEDMQTLVYNLYKRLRYYGVEAMLYDDQELTAEEYDNESYSAIKYDTLLGRVLFHDLKSMFNPFTGKFESVRDILNMLIRKVQWNGKTVSEYDGYEYTADEFDASTFNAYAQDTNKYITGTTPDLTGTTPDLKNKAYENYLLIAANVLYDGTDYKIPNTATAFSVDFDSKNYRFPVGQDFDYDLTINGSDNKSVYIVVDPTIFDDGWCVTFTGHNIDADDLRNLFAITPAKDVSELDK